MIRIRRRLLDEMACWMGSRQTVLCKLFNLSLWWSLLGLLDHLLCTDQEEGFTFCGGFYSKHNEDCPEV